ncbi:DUF6518 family protein [Streptomyces shenzhenensis]|uniref:DUF6518 family protein n=1 Tax=Streptomyces shenzhenensis TaxID=943815 RepID=UPI003D8ABD8F
MPTNAAFPLRSLALAGVTALTAGAVFGVLAPLLEPVGIPVVHAIHLVLAAGWSWSALAFCVGLAQESRLRAAVLASVSLMAAVFAYYVTKLEKGKFQLLVDMKDPAQGTQVHWAGFLSATVIWCIAAAVLGPILGLAGNLAWDRGVGGLPFRVLIPVLAVVETSVRLRFEASSQGALAGTAWSVTRLVAVAVIAVLVAHVVIGRRRRSRPAVGAGRRSWP